MLKHSELEIKCKEFQTTRVVHESLKLIFYNSKTPEEFRVISTLNYVTKALPFVVFAICFVFLFQLFLIDNECFVHSII